MSTFKNLAIIGGDNRQHYIGEHFSSNGYTVYSYSNNAGFIKCHSLDEILSKCTLILLPVPAVKNNLFLNTYMDIPILINDVYERLTPKQIVFGGCFPLSSKKYFEDNNIEYFDFMADESVACLNAVATAEGAIMEAIKESVVNIHDSSCLITGYGRCGKAIATRLKGLNAKITVAARKHEARCLARSNGYKAISLRELSSCSHEYDYVFNTIPTMVISPNVISRLKKHCIIIDIASYPGGTDFEFARKCGIKALLKLSIPGRISPKTSGLIICNSIEHYLNERS